MAYTDFDVPVKQIFTGNILLVICCAFYLAWWLLAFKPVGAIKGMKTGWLLIPAAAAGVLAVVRMIRGIETATMKTALFPGWAVVWGGIAAYLVLMAVTVLLFKRPVTTELLLIVGWAMLALAEINVLYGTGRFSCRQALLFCVIIGVAFLISLVCYVLYYRLDSRAGYLDGMVPLLLAAAVTAAVSVCMAI